MKVKGISNRQASLLARLQKQAGEKYSGYALSSAQASREIDRLLKSFERERPTDVVRAASYGPEDVDVDELLARPASPPLPVKNGTDRPHL